MADHPAAEPLLALIDDHGDDDDDPDGDELPEGLDIDEDQSVLDHGDDEGADHRADYRARAAEEAGAADHHRGDAVEKQGLARLGSTGGEARGVEDAADARR